MSGRSTRAKSAAGGGTKAPSGSNRGSKTAAPQTLASEGKASNFQELLADVARTDILKREALDSVIDNSRGPLARGRSTWLSSVTATFAGADTIATTDRDLAYRQESLLAQTLPGDGEGFFVFDPIDVPPYVLERVIAAVEDWQADADAALEAGDFGSNRASLSAARQASGAREQRAAMKPHLRRRNARCRSGPRALPPTLAAIACFSLICARVCGGFHRRRRCPALPLGRWAALDAGDRGCCGSIVPVDTPASQPGHVHQHSCSQ